MPITTLTTTGETGERRASAGDPDVLVRPVSDAAASLAWTNYVRQSPQATLFHDPTWAAAVADVFGHRPRHLVATRGPAVVGVLPLMEVRSWLAGTLLVSVPYGTYGGILGNDEEVHRALADGAVRVADECGARVVDLRSAEARAPQFEAVEGYLGFTRDLPLHPNDVPGFLPKRARAAARHARERDGVTVQHDAALAPVVWRLYSRSMRRIASLNYPGRFFRELFARLGERAWASVAWQGQRPIAGTISLVYHDTVMPYVLGVDDRVRCDGAANLLYWEVMERAVRSGLRRFDYGRSRADNVGAVGFKKNQGFEPRPLGYQRYVPPGRQCRI